MVKEVIMKRIGFLGPKGTFSHEALIEYVGNNKDFIPCDYSSIPDILIAAHNGEIDEAIVPVENSIEGAINATLDMMAGAGDLLIHSEIIINIRQNLLVRKGMKKEEIKCILSHPQPLGQCREYLNKEFPKAEIKAVYSTAGAAIEVAKGCGDCAAIGSIVSAKEYGLEVLFKNIQDGSNNLTRFVVLAKNDSERTGNDKTSIVFSTLDKPGCLYSILDIFNLWDINMTRIESRPAKDRLGRYIFFVDIKGHRKDEDVRDALTMIRRKTSFYKFLGSYPEYVLDDGL